MNHSVQIWIVIAVALVAANLPFVNERLFTVALQRAQKALGRRLAELGVMALAAFGIGAAFEAGIRQRAPQGSPFHAAEPCLFVVFAFPGFTWRCLRRRAP